MIKIHQTIGRIAGKPDDYKICRSCKTINWYENEECHNCLERHFRRMTEKASEQLLKEYDEDGLDVDSWIFRGETNGIELCGLLRFLFPFGKESSH